MSCCPSPSSRPVVHRLFSSPISKGKRPQSIPIPAPRFPSRLTRGQPHSTFEVTSSSPPSPASTWSYQSSALLSPPLQHHLDTDVPFRPKEDDLTSLDQHSNVRRRHRRKRRIKSENKPTITSHEANRKVELCVSLKGQHSSWNWDSEAACNDIASLYTPESQESLSLPLLPLDEPKLRSKSVIEAEKFARSLISREARRLSLISNQALPASTHATAFASVSNRRSSRSVKKIPSPSRIQHHGIWKPAEASRYQNRRRSADPVVQQKDTPASIMLRKASQAYCCNDSRRNSRSRRVSKPYIDKPGATKEAGVIFYGQKDASLPKGSRIRSGSYRPTTWESPPREEASRRHSSSGGHGTAADTALTLANVHVSLKARSPSESRRASRVEKSVRRLNSIVQISTGISNQQVIWSQDDSRSSHTASTESPLNILSPDAMVSTSSLTKRIPSRMNSVAGNLENLVATPGVSRQFRNQDNIEKDIEMGVASNGAETGSSASHYTTEMFGWSWNEPSPNGTLAENTEPGRLALPVIPLVHSAPTTPSFDADSHVVRNHQARRRASFSSVLESFPPLSERRPTDEWKTPPMTDLNGPFRCPSTNPHALVTIDASEQTSWEPSKSDNAVMPESRRQSSVVMSKRFSRGGQVYGSSFGQRRKSFHPNVSHTPFSDLASAVGRRASQFCVSFSKAAMIPSYEDVVEPNTWSLPSSSWPRKLSTKPVLRRTSSDHGGTDQPLAIAPFTWKRIESTTEGFGRISQVAGRDEDENGAEDSQTRMGWVTDWPQTEMGENSAK